jgi:hypothetical protein
VAEREDMSISSLSSLATTAFDTARSTLKAMADAATAPPAASAETAADTAADLGAMTRDTVDVSSDNATAKGPAPVVAEEEAPVRPRSRLGNSLDSYA